MDVADQAHRLLAIGRFTDQLELLYRADQRRRRPAEDQLVVDDQHRDARIGGHDRPSERYSSVARTRGWFCWSPASPSLAKIELMCFSTALGERTSWSATAAFVRPCAMR